MNYKKLGFKSGLEIHAQLDVGKLFCRCPSVLRQDEPDFKVRRELRPLAGETGEVDVAALYEKKKQLHYIYEGYNDTTCLVELDEAPPRPINKEALGAALALAKMMHCKIPKRAQIMRKTVVDGSNTSGFQRTVLIGYDGWIKVSQSKTPRTRKKRVGRKKIKINYIILEEDAARRVDETKKSVTYRLDRLGSPLLEIVTAPDLKTPEQVKTAAQHIGMLVKSTGRAMGGLGSIRQDINISIKGHCRVELKGVQDLKLMKKYIDAEIKRQKLKKNEDEEEHVRNVEEDFSSKFLRPLPTSARMYPETDLPLIKITKRRLNKVKVPELLTKKEKRYKKLLNEELASQLVSSDYHSAFDEFRKKFKKLEPKHIASTLLSTGAEVKKKLDLDEFEPREEDFEYLFAQQNEGKISLQASTDVFVEVAKGKEIRKAAALFKKLSKAQLKKEIKKLKKKHRKAPKGKLKGIIIGKLKDKADVKDIIKNI